MFDFCIGPPAGGTRDLFKLRSTRSFPVRVALVPSRLLPRFHAHFLSVVLTVARLFCFRYAVASSMLTAALESGEEKF